MHIPLLCVHACRRTFIVYNRLSQPQHSHLSTEACSHLICKLSRVGVCHVMTFLHRTHFYSLCREAPAILYSSSAILYSSYNMVACVYRKMVLMQTMMPCLHESLEVGCSLVLRNGIGDKRGPCTQVWEVLTQRTRPSKAHSVALYVSMFIPFTRPSKPLLFSPTLLVLPVALYPFISNMKDIPARKKKKRIYNSYANHHYSNKSSSICH